MQPLLQQNHHYALLTHNWQNYTKDNKYTIYSSTENKFKNGIYDHYKLVKKVKGSSNSTKIDLSKLPRDKPVYRQRQARLNGTGWARPNGAGRASVGAPACGRQV